MFAIPLIIVNDVDEAITKVAKKQPISTRKKASRATALSAGKFSSSRHTKPRVNEVEESAGTGGGHPEEAAATAPIGRGPLPAISKSM